MSTNDVRYVDLWIDETKPAGTVIAPQVSFDSGVTWLNMTNVAQDDRLLDASAVPTVERHYVYDTGSNTVLKDKVKLKVNMTTTTGDSSPSIKRLRSVARTI